MLKKMLLNIVTIVTFLVLFHPESFGQDKLISALGDKPSAPIEVEFYFSSEPILNQTNTLNFKVTVLQDAPNTSIKFAIPGEGFVSLSGNTEITDSLSKGEAKIYQVDVLPVSLGQYKITASAVSTNGTYVFGKTLELYVILDEQGTKVSQTNIFDGETTTTSESKKISDISQQLIHIPLSGKSNQEQNPFEFIAPGPGQIAVRGFWYYRDKNGVDRVLRDARIEIWDLDTFSSDDLLYTTYTNNSGYYESGNISNTGDEAGGQDIYVKVYSTDNFSVSVTDLSGNLYFSQTPTISNVLDGYVDAGSYSVTDVNNKMAYYIYDKIANDAYDYLANNVGWVNSYNLQVRWTPTSSTGTYYIPGGTIDLVAGDRWDIDVFFHEYGHFVMYKIYGNTIPPTTNCNPHNWGSHSSLGCAWVEGWANFLQGAIQNDRNYDDTEDQTLHIDYEPPTPVAHHAEDEGAVAASLWDIFDAGAESWDSLNNGINGSSNSGIWKIASVNRPNDVVQFYNNWNSSTNGFNSETTSILQHHDIIPNPVLTTSLTLSPSGPYVVGQTVTGRFSITNRGNRSITLEMLTIGGRLNNDTTVADFPAQTNITLSPNQTYNYVGNFTFTQTGNYRFFPAYRLAGNVWKIGLLNEIPADPGIIYNLNFNVSGATCPSPSSIIIGQTINGSLQSGDCTYTDGSYYDAYTFNGTSGQQIYITLNSTQFNAYLLLYQGAYPGGTFRVGDDNGGGGTNARIPASSGYYTLPATATYTILANSLAANEVGNYTLFLGTNSVSTTGKRFDFDGDGKADASVYRPSDGYWHILNSQSGYGAFRFGLSTDKIVPADYDGDGRTDYAIYRPGEGKWYLQRSSLGFTAFNFGLSSDIPMPADYDGDGKADVAVYRPSNGRWYVSRTLLGYTEFQFGLNGDKVVSADYDADGKADIGIYRPSNGKWYIQRSSAGYVEYQFGIAEDKPVPADFDADGKADIAVYRPSIGRWYVQRSTAGYQEFQFGLSADKPSPADYDGDGKADFAVYRPSNGVWYIQKSSLGFTAFNFGLSTDLSVPSAFVQ